VTDYFCFTTYVIFTLNLGPVLAGSELIICPNDSDHKESSNEVGDSPGCAEPPRDLDETPEELFRTIRSAPSSVVIVIKPSFFVAEIEA